MKKFEYFHEYFRLRFSLIEELRNQLKKFCVCVLVTQSCPTLCNPMGCGLAGCSLLQACMEFSRQEYWNGQPFPSPGNLPRDQTRVSCIAVDSFRLSHQGSLWMYTYIQNLQVCSRNCICFQAEGESQAFICSRSQVNTLLIISVTYSAINTREIESLYISFIFNLKHKH